MFLKNPTQIGHFLSVSQEAKAERGLSRTPQRKIAGSIPRQSIYVVIIMEQERVPIESGEHQFLVGRTLGNLTISKKLGPSWSEYIDRNCF